MTNRKLTVVAGVYIAVSVAALGQPGAGYVFQLPGLGSSNGQIVGYSYAANPLTPTVNAVGPSGTYQIVPKPDGTGYYILGATLQFASAALTSVTNVNGIASAPTALAVSPDGNYTVVGAGAAYVLSASTNQVLATVATNGTIVGIAISPDSRSAYVLTNTPVDSLVTQINLATRAQVGPPLQLTGGATSISFSPLGLLYVGAVNRVFEIDPILLQVTPSGTFTPNATPGPLHFTPDGIILYFANITSNIAGGSIVQINLSSSDLVSWPSNQVASIHIDDVLVAGNNRIFGISYATTTLFDVNTSPLSLTVSSLNSVLNNQAQAVAAAAVSSELPSALYLYAVVASSAGTSVLDRITLSTNQLSGQVSAVEPGGIWEFVAVPPQTGAASFIQHNNNLIVTPGVTSLPLMAQVLDLTGRPIFNLPVSFTTPAGNGITITNPNPATNANGYVQTTLVAAASPGIYSITLTAGTANTSFAIDVTASGSGPATGPVTIATGPVFTESVSNPNSCPSTAPTPVPAFHIGDPTSTVWLGLLGLTSQDSALLRFSYNGTPEPTLDWNYPAGSFQSGVNYLCPSLATGPFGGTLSQTFAFLFPGGGGAGSWSLGIYIDGSSSPIATVPFNVFGDTMVAVQAKLTSNVTGLVNGSCNTPPPVASFTSTSPAVWLYFNVTGAVAGDLAQVKFLRPDGVLYSSSSYPVPTLGQNGSTCFASQIAMSGTSAASYPGMWSIQVFWDQATTPLFTLNFTVTNATGNLPAIQNVVTAEAFGGFTSIAPGSWIEIYGTNLGPSAGQTWAGSDFNGNQAPISLGGTSVTIGGQSAYTYYVSAGQVNVQVPSGVAAGTQPVVVTTASGVSAAYNILAKPTQPGLLAPPSFIFNGQQYAVALVSGTSTYVLPFTVPGISTAAPNPGSTITLYGVGFGPVTPNIPAGQIASGSNALSSFQIYFAGVPATVTYAGLAPGEVGLYQFNVVVPNIPASSSVPLTFSLNGTSGSQTLFTAVETFSPAANIQIVSGNNQTAAVNAPFSAPLAVAVTDAQGNAVSGVTVSFAVTAGTASLSPASSVTNAQGLASIRASAAGPGSIVVTASYNSLSAKFSLTSVGQAAATIQIVSGNNQTAVVNTSFSAPLVVVVEDAQGNPVSGVNVSFAISSGTASVSPNSAVTNAQGQASTIATASSNPGSIAITASYASLSVTFSLTAVQGSGATASAYLQILAGNNQSTLVGQAFAQAIVVEVVDSVGNPLTGVTVSFTVVQGSAILSAASAVTNAQGNASAKVTAGQTPGLIQIRVTAAGTSSITTFTLTAQDTISNITAISGNNQIAIVGQSFSAPLVVQVTDAQNNPVGGITVSFSVASGGASISPTTALTTAQGQASVNVTAGSSSGPIVVTASYGALSTSFSLTAVLP